MLEALLADEPDISISLLESERQPPSYTIDTLKELHKRVGDHDYYLIIGADSFLEIHLWYQYEKIFNFTNLIVAARAGISDSEMRDQADRLPGGFQYDGEQHAWRRQDKTSIFLLQDVDVPLSSSEIREQLCRGRDVSGQLPPEVIDYIYSHSLYDVPSDGT